MHFDFRLWTLTEGFRHRIAAAVAMGLVSSVLGIARLALLGWLLGFALSGAAPADIIVPIAAVLATILIRGAWDYWRTMNAHHTGAAIQRIIRARIFDHIVKLGPAKFAHARTGDITTAAVDGVEHLGVYYGQYLPCFLVALLTPPVIFMFVAFLDVTVAGVLLGAALFTLLAPALFHKWDSKNAMSRSRAFKDFSSTFLDSLQGLGTLKSFGRSGSHTDILAEKAYKLTHATKWVLATSSLTRGITDTGIAVGAAAALAAGAFQVVEGAMTLPTLFIILMLGVEVFRPLRDLRSVLHDGMLSLAASKQIFGILDEGPLVKDAPETNARPGDIAPSIEFRDVTFQYPGGRGKTHRNVGFVIGRGERVAIVGPSGSGKSSIVRLLSRFHDPDRGAVSIGGHDLRTLPFDVIRDQMAIVSQDTHLFHGNVTENLLLGNPKASREQLIDAAKAANAHDFIMSLADGYETVIGERGVRLSGGQRQRIAIARALLRDAPVLVLDEALSSVDAENEMVIQEALDRLMAGRTTLILAHRLSSVIGADRILVLDEGRIVEQGTHAQLMSQQGVYHRLMVKQVEERSGVVEGMDVDPVEKQHAAEAGQGEIAHSGKFDSLLRAEGLGWGGAIIELMKHVCPWKGELVLTFALGVSRVVAFIGVSVLSALAVVAVKNGDPFMDHLYWLAVLAPAAGVLHWLESWVAHDMAFNLLADMRIKLFKKLDQLAPAFLTGKRSGDIVSLATHDVDTVEYFFAHTIAPAFVAILVPASALALLYSFHWMLAVALVAPLVCVALTPVFMRSRIDRIGSEVREAFGLMSSHTVETLQGLAEVLSFGAASRRRKAFLELVDWFQEIKTPFVSDNALRTIFVEVMTGAGVLAVILTGIYLSNSSQIDGGYLPLLALVSMAAFLPVSEIADVGRQLANTLGATQRLKAVHDEEVLIKSGPKSIVKPRSGGMAIRLDDVTFSYPGTRRPALKDVSIEIPAGKTVALVGASGAGKSTLAHLLMRFWDPDTGMISIGGAPFTECDLDELRHATAMVAQDTFLFNDTLRANLLIADPEADDDRISQALTWASLKTFVDSLSEGLETMVGERGFSLSGGQRQRVAIARAFLKDSPVLILDEATSHLDTISERHVHSALERLMADRTTLVIAHRLSTVRGADLIAVLDHGRIVETGNHDSLIAKGGYYANLVNRQMTAGNRGAAA